MADFDIICRLYRIHLKKDHDNLKRIGSELQTYLTRKRHRLDVMPTANQVIFYERPRKNHIGGISVVGLTDATGIMTVVSVNENDGWFLRAFEAFARENHWTEMPFNRPTPPGDPGERMRAELEL